MLKHIRMFLQVRRRVHEALPDPRTQLALVPAPAPFVHLHEALHRVRHARQVRLCVDHARTRNSAKDRGRQRVRVGRGRRRRGGGCERGQREVSRDIRAPDERSDPYRFCLAPPDDTLGEHADPLPVLDQEAHLAPDKAVGDELEHTRGK